GEGVDVSRVVRDPGAPTGVFFREVRAHDDPSVYYYRRGSAASRLSPDDVRPDWFEGARHLHVTGITPALGPRTEETVLTGMGMARERGLTVSFDPNVRRKLWNESDARRTLLGMVPLCDAVMPGIDEASLLTGETSPEVSGRRLLEMGPSIVVL